MNKSLIESSLILIVDDNLNNLQVLGNFLKLKNYKTDFATSGKAAFDWLDKKPFDLILLDITMPEMDGYEVCTLIRRQKEYKDIPIIFLTSKTDRDDILKGFNLGAQDYITKPFDEEILLARVETHLLLYKMQKNVETIIKTRTTELEISQLELKKQLLQVEILKNKLHDENQYMQEEIKLNNNFEEIIGESKSLKSTLKNVQQVASTNSTVLIKGETGTGKELIARSIHNLSKRKDQPLIKLNCAAIPESLIESELFGHEKGAFTGAIATRKGKFEIAHNGTLFLDEIGELPLSLQPKLLRVIQEGEIERVGSNKIIKVNVRLISATNRNINKMVDEGGFRADLFYRLNAFPIEIAPLRERVEDIKPLVRYFMNNYTKKFGKNSIDISEAQTKILCDYSWPGNVREMENLLERAIILSTGKQLKLDPDFFNIEKNKSLVIKSLDEFERDYILQVLESVNWSISGENGAANLLKIHPNTLRSRMQKLNIKKHTSFK
ncbi:MAG: sigma-54 dependent transcriptional regulator [Salinivirgaceae bacterium]|jgi:formate hydrogenlyase transcriptional activator|nr:sigma-54 dependent transcriptional regulator [Salinivirgaceae bacterium]